MIGAAARFAGQRLLVPLGKAVFKGGKALGKRTINNLGPMNAGNLTAMIAPDLLFGAMYAAQTPGDMTDKVIAGTGSAIGGAVGGVGLRGAIGVKNPGLGMAVDFMGSIGGDMAGQAASDQILRTKDKLSGGLGLSPFEKQQMEYEMQMKEAMKREALQELIRAQSIGERIF